VLDQLVLLIQSGHPIISVETLEEERATNVVRKAAEKLGHPLFEWSITTGMERTVPDFAETGVKRGNAAVALDYILDNKGEREIYLLKDLSPHCKEPMIQRQLRDIDSRKKVHVILMDHAGLPETVHRLAVPVQLALPDAAELEHIVRDTYRRILRESFSEHTATVTRKDMEQLVQMLRGLTAVEATRVVSLAINADEVFSAEAFPRVVEAKRNLLRSAGCLETVNANVSPDEIGGLLNLKSWLARRRGGLTSKGQAFGLDPPRGMLLLGVQGCGKSLCARVVASDWNMPLLRMDPGLLYQKYIGESENRLREALAQAESMAPAVLWIDEIEKAFASASSDSADGGLSQRMFGTLLTWMQDHRSPLFMVATANNIAALPPELMRKGRFDEVFFVDLPTPAVRQKILAIHLKRRKRDPDKFLLDKLAAATEGFSGAELEQAVVSAMYAAFSAGKELTDDFFLEEAKRTQPLSVLMGERVRDLRKWAANRCVPAD
jgi:ATPase family associated with various cellular activities (AAA)